MTSSLVYLTKSKQNELKQKNWKKQQIRKQSSLWRQSNGLGSNSLLERRRSSSRRRRRKRRNSWLLKLVGPKFEVEEWMSDGQMNDESSDNANDGLAFAKWHAHEAHWLLWGWQKESEGWFQWQEETHQNMQSVIVKEEKESWSINSHDRRMSGLKRHPTIPNR